MFRPLRAILKWDIIIIIIIISVFEGLLLLLLFLFLKDYFNTTDPFSVR
jgi:hypothetical protein